MADIKKIKANGVDYDIATSWGKIEGTLSNQTDLNQALEGKMPATTKYGAGLNYTNNKLQLKDQDGNALGNEVTITGGSGAAAWGSITGTLSDQTDLNQALAGKAASGDIKDSTITFTQGGVTKGTITLNQATASTVEFDKGGDPITYDSSKHMMILTQGGVSGGSGSTTWGSITGTLSDQTDLQAALDSKSKPTRDFIHVSMDDTSTIIDYINNTSNSSIYGNTLLKAMKELHESYGMVFSLYLFKNLSFNTTTASGAAKKAELFAARKWLKFGYHRIGDKFCDQLTVSEATTIWNTFVTSTFNCTGSLESIDRIPRLDYFRTGTNGLTGFRDATCGMLGVLIQDDVRTDNIYLTSEQSHWLVGIEDRDSSVATNWYPKDYITDYNLGLRNYKTDLRLDWICNTSSTFQNHDKATGENSGNPVNLYNTLVNWYTDIRHSDAFCPFIIFFHEVEWTSGRLTKTWFEKIAQFASEYGLDFDFPQNRFYTNLTKKDIFPTT